MARAHTHTQTRTHARTHTHEPIIKSPGLKHLPLQRQQQQRHFYSALTTITTATTTVTTIVTATATVQGALSDNGGSGCQCDTVPGTELACQGFVALPV